MGRVETPLQTGAADAHPPAANGDSLVGAHPMTRQAHEDAVRRVIETMRERYGEPLTLEDMAGAALMSPYYAIRVFRAFTGVQPRRFLAALRFDAAKRMLLTSAHNVTDICFRVGYSSLGSFTSRFGQSVGLSPRQLRRYVRDGAADIPNGSAAAASPPPAGNAVIHGHARAEEGYDGLMFVGVFPSPLPESFPLSCTVAWTPGHFRLESVGPGGCHVLAASFPQAHSRLDYLLPEQEQLRVAAEPVEVGKDGAGSDIELDLELRPLEPTDPPILTALPYLLERALGKPEDAFV